MSRDRIELRRYGSTGPTVVVLHGGPGATGSAAGLARALADSFQVLEPLQRRAGPLPLSVAQHVEDLSVVAPERTLLVGHSWGAMLGLSYAAKHPDRVGALALVGCGTYGEADRALYRGAMNARLGPEGIARVGDLSRRLDAEPDSARRDRLLAELGEVLERAMTFDAVDDDGTLALPADARGREQTWQDALRLQREGVEPAAFAAIRCPVRMFHGQDDPHPGLATRDTLARFVRKLDYVGFERCGHQPWRERHAREPFVRALRAWLKDVPER